VRATHLKSFRLLLGANRHPVLDEDDPGIDEQVLEERATADMHRMEVNLLLRPRLIKRTAVVQKTGPNSMKMKRGQHDSVPASETFARGALQLRGSRSLRGSAADVQIFARGKRTALPGGTMRCAKEGLSSHASA
jgi:hypothetical protein